MKSLIIKKMSKAENDNYIGLPSEQVNVIGVGIAIHNGITKGGNLISFDEIGTGKNLLRNANFSVLQNGNEWLGNTGNTYIADGWYLQHGGTTTTNAAVSDWHANNIEGTRNSLRVTTIDDTPSSNSFAVLSQRFVGIELLSGRYVTLSFKARVATGTLRIAAEFGQSYKTATPDTASFFGNADLTTEWQDISFTLRVPDMPSNYSINSDSCNYIYLWLRAGDAFNGRTGGINNIKASIDIANVQLEVGKVANNFECRTLNEEKRLVQEYFEVHNGQPFPLSKAGLLSTTSDVNNIFGLVPYRTIKRKTPIVENLTWEHSTRADIIWIQDTGFTVAGVSNSDTSIARVTGFTANAEIIP